VNSDMACPIRSEDFTSYMRNINTTFKRKYYQRRTTIVEHNDRMRKGWIIHEVSLAVRRLGWGQRRLHCETFSGKIPDPRDVTQRP
jgi:hypothetical protein